VTHPVDIEVGRKIRLRRAVVGLSQEALGEAIGVTFQQIQKYERGLNRVSSSSLFQFAKALSVPISYFFEDVDKSVVKAVQASGAKKLSESEHEKMSSREAHEMMRAYYSIPDPRARKRAFELIKAIAAKEKGNS
jgi:transcriptional regulator with XRE-family HTH domain